MICLVRRKRTVWTPRELDVLRILSRLNGSTDRQIGVELDIAENTVTVYISRLMTKAGLSREERNRTRLSAMAGAILERMA